MRAGMGGQTPRRWCFFVPSRRVRAAPGGDYGSLACDFARAIPLRLMPTAGITDRWPLAVMVGQ